MARLAVLLLLILSACVEGGAVVTSTPIASLTPRAPLATVTPAIPIVTPLATNTSAPTPTIDPPTPTQETIASNPHAQCVADNSDSFERCDILNNGLFAPPYVYGLTNGRTTASPAGWSFYWSRDVLGINKEQISESPPNTTCGGGVCVSDIAWWSGAVGYSAGGTNSTGISVYAGQRYLLKVSYDVVCTSTDFQIDTSAVRLGATVNNTELVVKLPNKLSSGQETIWLLQARGNDDVRLTVRAIVPFGVCGRGAFFTWRGIELFPLPANWGDNPTPF